MKTTKTQFATVDEYIQSFPPEVQEVLQQLRRIIHEEAPGVEERISYQIPAFRFEEAYLIYFAGYKKHVGMYPTTAEMDTWPELTPYLSGKASIRFPLSQPLPVPLIRKILAHKIAHNRAKG